MTAVVYREDSAGAAQICAHLGACDAAFILRLSARVEIAAYAEKLAARARRFEAWGGDELVGLVAAYCNAADRQQAFITSVSVLPHAQGQGIASQLVERCIAAIREAGFRRLELEVGAENKGAIALYEKHGLRAVSDAGGTALMAIELNGTR